MFGRKKLQNRIESLEKERDKLAALAISSARGIVDDVAVSDQLDEDTRHQFLRSSSISSAYYALKRGAEATDDNIWQRMFREEWIMCKERLERSGKG